MVAVTAKASWSVEGAKELIAAEYERKFAKLPHVTPGVPGGPRRPHRSETEERNARASANRIGIVRRSRELCSNKRARLCTSGMGFILAFFDLFQSKIKMRSR
jgi:hypothetical protein